jgi:hypothetical protein
MASETVSRTVCRPKCEMLVGENVMVLSELLYLTKDGKGAPFKVVLFTQSGFYGL